MYLLPEVEENLKTAIDKQLLSIKDITVTVTIESDNYNLVLSGEALRWYLQGVIDTEKKLNKQFEELENSFINSYHINKDLPDDF